jgi:two-component sensor histidine kinase
MALHELATNAAKYGALSTSGGGVAIRWRRLPASEGHGVELTWEERGGPGVAPPEHRGFGTLVIERHLARSLDTEVELSFPPEGVRCRIVIPLMQFIAAR